MSIYFVCYVDHPVLTSSPDPTPERDAVLQAGLSALLRAKDTPAQTPMVWQNVIFKSTFNVVFSYSMYITMILFMVNLHYKLQHKCEAETAKLPDVVTHPRLNHFNANKKKYGWKVLLHILLDYLLKIFVNCTF